MPLRVSNSIQRKISSGLVGIDGVSSSLLHMKWDDEEVFVEKPEYREFKEDRDNVEALCKR